jgi:hypothetical protein
MGPREVSTSEHEHPYRIETSKPILKCRWVVDYLAVFHLCKRIFHPAENVRSIMSEGQLRWVHSIPGSWTMSPLLGPVRDNGRQGAALPPGAEHTHSTIHCNSMQDVFMAGHSNRMRQY